MAPKRNTKVSAAAAAAAELIEQPSVPAIENTEPVTITEPETPTPEPTTTETVAPDASTTTATTTPTQHINQATEKIAAFTGMGKDLLVAFKELAALFKQVTKDFAALEKENAALRKENARGRGRGKRAARARAAAAAVGEDGTPAAPAQPKGGLAKPVLIRAELCEFLGVPLGTLVGRNEVTKAFVAYVKANGLANPEDKRKINPDAKLSGLLSPGWEVNGLTYLNLQTYLKHQYKPLETAETAETTEAGPAATTEETPETVA